MVAHGTGIGLRNSLEATDISNSRKIVGMNDSDER